MPDYKCTFFFKGCGHGWSETLYTTQADHDAALTKMDQYRFKRVPLLGDGFELASQRVSDIAVRGDSRVRSIDSTVKKGHSNAADVPWNSAKVRLDAGPNKRRTLELRGLQDSQITVSPSGKILFDNAAQQAKWTAFLNEVAGDPNNPGNNWFLRGLSFPQNFQQATDITNLDPGTVLKIQHGLTTGDKITLSKCRGLVEANGQWFVQVVDDNNFDLVGSKFFKAEDYVQGTGVWFKHSHAMFEIDRAQVVRVGSRDTGAPFDRPHGRRSNRRRLAV